MNLFRNSKGLYFKLMKRTRARGPVPFNKLPNLTQASRISACPHSGGSIWLIRGGRACGERISRVYSLALHRKPEQYVSNRASPTNGAGKFDEWIYGGGGLIGLLIHKNTHAFLLCCQHTRTYIDAARIQSFHSRTSMKRHTQKKGTNTLTLYMT